MNNYQSNHWIKFGTIKLPPMPDAVLSAPVVIGKGHRHITVADSVDGDFWFQREWDTALTKTYNGIAVDNYLSSLGLPDFEYKSVSFIASTMSWDWHIDARAATINVAVQNGNACTTEFDDGTSYTMENGDVYFLDVKRKHRTVFKPGIMTQPRIILSICLNEEFQFASTQKIIENLKTHFSNL